MPIMCIVYFLKHLSPLKGGSCLWARYIVRACVHATHIEANARYCGKTSMEFYHGATVMYDLETNVATTVQAPTSPVNVWSISMSRPYRKATWSAFVTAK